MNNNGGQLPLAAGRSAVESGAQWLAVSSRPAGVRELFTMLNLQMGLCTRLNLSDRNTLICNSLP
jgi:hypothetical protein